MTKDTLLAEAADALEAQVLGTWKPSHVCMSLARQLRAREDAGKADALDAARWRKFVSLDTLDARDAVERWGTGGLDPIIDKVIAFDEKCLSTKPEAGEGEGR